MLSNDEEETEASVKAITFWCLLKNGFDDNANVPEILINELVDIIKNLRQPAFNKVLERMKYLMIQVPDVFNKDQYSIIINSLIKLEKMTRLPDISIVANGEFSLSLCKNEELPDYRARISEVASTIYMNIKNKKITLEDSTNNSITDLKGIFIKDIFPEVNRPWIDVEV
jgi:hypothetical protein